MLELLFEEKLLRNLSFFFFPPGFTQWLSLFLLGCSCAPVSLPRFPPVRSFWAAYDRWGLRPTGFRTTRRVRQRAHEEAQPIGRLCRRLCRRPAAEQQCNACGFAAGLTSFRAGRATLFAKLWRFRLTGSASSLGGKAAPSGKSGGFLASICGWIRRRICQVCGG